jgi:hypothetical protein
MSGSPINNNNVIGKYNSVAPVEIKMAFDLPEAEFEKVQNSLLEKQLITKRDAGNGSFITSKNNPLACDIVTGACMQ